MKISKGRIALVSVMLGCLALAFSDIDSRLSNEFSGIDHDSKYKVGDIVRSTTWENESYWEGEVVKILKGVVYQVQITSVRAKGAMSVYLNPTECSGKKRLSYEDGEDYNKTKIWVHERCLD